MRMINRKFTFLTTIFTFILVVFAITQTFAWISKVSDNKVIINFGDFSVQVVAQDNANTDPNNTLKMVKGTYKLNGLDKTVYDNAYARLTEKYPTKYPIESKSKNPFIKDFNMTITILEAQVAGYIRIRLLDEWLVTRQYLTINSITNEIIFISKNSGQEGDGSAGYAFPFVLNENWFYDPATNYCYYDKMIEKGSTNLVLPFITAGVPYSPKNNDAFVETCNLTFGTSIQVAQANRFEELWGIPTIPTRPVAPTPEPQPNPDPNPQQ